VRVKEQLWLQFSCGVFFFCDGSYSIFQYLTSTTLVMRFRDCAQKLVHYALTPPYLNGSKISGLVYIL
jgi:hypothetical protein